MYLVRDYLLSTYCVSDSMESLGDNIEIKVPIAGNEKATNGSAKRQKGVRLGSSTAQVCGV